MKFKKKALLPTIVLMSLNTYKNGLSNQDNQEKITHYAILNVPSDSSSQDIRDAFKKKPLLIILIKIPSQIPPKQCNVLIKPS